MHEQPACLVISEKAAVYAEEIRRQFSEAQPGRDRSADQPVLIECLTAAEALSRYSDQQIVFGRPDLIAEVLSQMPSVRWVQSTWAGVAPLLALPRRDYALTGVKGVFNQQMAEYVFGHILARELRIAPRQAAQAERRWDTSPSRTLAGRRLGIMGTGSIGHHIALVAARFGLRVTGYSRSAQPVDGFEHVFGAQGLAQFLSPLDFLVSTLPDTTDTRHLLNTKALSNLPNHAHIVNVGRGSVIDEKALTEALAKGQLGAATLDVFETEPLPVDHPLWTTPNVTITAHVAAVSHPHLIVPIFLSNYRRFARGRPLRYRIDFAAGY